jgi:CubicO group peptidase (beta-lactamase class C family)
MGRLSTITAGVLAVALVAVGSTAAAAPASPAISPDTRSFAAEVKRAAALLRMPGYAVAVVQDGKIIYRLNSGYADVERQTPVTDDTLFSLASVTKTFTAVILMQYEAEKRVSLDDNPAELSPRHVEDHAQHHRRQHAVEGCPQHDVRRPAGADL